MVAMLVLVQFLMMMMMMMMMMKSEAASAEIVTVSAQSGETVLLFPDQLREMMQHRWDVRWTHPPHLVLSLKTNVTTCPHGRCELLSNGSLKFSRVQTEDSGNYSLQVFDQSGKRQVWTDFLLGVAESPHTDNKWLLICCPLLVFLLLLFIILFILRMRRIQRTRTTGPMEENVYVWMHGHHGNKRKEEEEKQAGGEEPVYVPCHPAVSMETPITPEMSVEPEDIYV
ncbi:uncharacterized protein [Trachinotus anak]|uniref:uncharacterized protein n=1 Tax=Trachinotus anak TaxID=443729 RepID=UPI0039F17507